MNETKEKLAEVLKRHGVVVSSEEAEKLAEDIISGKFKAGGKRAEENKGEMPLPENLSALKGKSLKEAIEEKE